MRDRHIRPAAVAVEIDRDVAMVGRYARGDSPIPDDIKATLAEFFGVSRAYLMGWENDPHTEPVPVETAA
jgi:hypothetical protein